jgi:hypothetical protein
MPGIRIHVKRLRRMERSRAALRASITIAEEVSRYTSSFMIRTAGV